MRGCTSPSSGDRRAMSRKKIVLDEDEDPFAFLTQPEKSLRTYDSTLSKPGKYCKVCRSFVSGGLKECHTCWTAV
jgi:hypothetical protein